MDIKRKIYEEIEAQSSNYGTYHKCLFHLHTYASHDYAVLQKYKDNNSQEKINTKITHEEIINLCKNNNLLPQETFSKTVKRVSEEYADTFNDEEELLVYLLIVWELIRNKYELVVVTDHNTIKGYNKLLKAKKIMRDYRDSIVKKEGYKYPSIILGIEISCADKNHVVGVFDDSKENIFDKINSFIKESVMTEVLGTFKTSLDVLKTIESIGGIGYIAHMNSSPMISKKDKFLSGGYTNKLLRLKEFSAVGLHNITQLNNVQQWINQHTDKEFAYVIDSDSHAVDTIKDNYFWIKGQKCNYQMIEEAIRDYNIAIRYEIPHPPKSFIKGIYLKNVGKGFLLDYNKNESLTLQLSSSLNCIIGGRGTGKSTLLNIIALILGQSFLNESVYNALCDYDELWLLFRHEHCDYLVNFMPRKKQYDSDDAFQDLNDVLRDRYRLEIHNHNDIQNELYKKIILKDCIYVYSIDDEGNICEESTDVLNEFFDRSYSVNELVKTASSDEINQYISEMMGLKFDAIKSSFRSLSGLNKFISRLDNVLDQRKKYVEKEIDKFNNDESIDGKIKIQYNQNKNVKNFIDFKVLTRSVTGYLLNGEEYFQKKNISVSGIIGFLEVVCRKYGLIKFLNLLLQNELHLVECDLLMFCTDINATMINHGIEKIDNITKKQVLKSINKIILEKEGMYLVNKFKNDYLSKVENFTLLFNVMNKEGGGKANYKDIKTLSLGQKVVAMLSFVFGYTDYIKDYRPLIIDQPEDNLDNQYIYKNLVDDLRRIKGKRQVIIATHNATIVTNAKAEEVIVMESDGCHGWVAARGYPTQKGIKRHIINYMEGGIESFKHKISIYHEVLYN